MPRYIDADALIKKVFPYDVVDPKCYSINAKAVYVEIKSALTADVVEVKHGEWENMGDNFANCSHCGTIFEALPTMFAFKANNIFCRHCGAKMDGGSDT